MKTRGSNHVVVSDSPHEASETVEPPANDGETVSRVCAIFNVRHVFG
jgi:hypothetical protein